MDKYLYPYEVKDRLTNISILAGAEGTVLYEVPPEGYELDNMGMSEEQLILLNKLITNKNDAYEFINCNDDVLKCCAFLFKYNIKITENMVNILVDKLITKNNSTNSIMGGVSNSANSAAVSSDEKKTNFIAWEESKIFINLTNDTFLYIADLSKLHHENQIVGCLVDKAAKALLNTWFNKSPSETYHNMLNNDKIEYMIAFQTLVNLCGEIKQNVPIISGDIWDEVMKYSKMYWCIVKTKRRALYADDNIYATLNSDPSLNDNIRIGSAIVNERYNNTPYITYDPYNLDGLNRNTITIGSMAGVNNNIMGMNQSNDLYYNNEYITYNPQFINYDDRIYRG